MTIALRVNIVMMTGLMAASSVRAGDIAGVTPSIAQIVADVKHSSPAAGMLASRQQLAQALAQAAQGKEGPLLVVSDGTRLRIMGLDRKNGINQH